MDELYVVSVLFGHVDIGHHLLDFCKRVVYGHVGYPSFEEFQGLLLTLLMYLGKPRWVVLVVTAGIDHVIVSGNIVCKRDSLSVGCLTSAWKSSNEKQRFAVDGQGLSVSFVDNTPLPSVE